MAVAVGAALTVGIGALADWIASKKRAEKAVKQLTEQLTAERGAVASLKTKFGEANAKLEKWDTIQKRNADPRGFALAIEQNHKALVDHVASVDFKKIKKAPHKMFIVHGQTSAGKSRMENELFGLNLEVDDDATTQHISLVAKNAKESAWVWDSVGDNPLELVTNMETLLAVIKAHVNVVIFDGTVKNAIPLLQYIISAGSNFILVRGKADVMKSPAATIEQRELAVLRKEGITKVDKIYFWSAEPKTKEHKDNNEQFKEVLRNQFPLDDKFTELEKDKQSLLRDILEDPDFESLFHGHFPELVEPDAKKPRH